MRVIWNQTFTNHNSLKFNPNNFNEIITLKNDIQGSEISVEISNEFDFEELEIKSLRFSIFPNFDKFIFLKYKNNEQFKVPPLKKIWSDVVEYDIPQNCNLYFELVAENQQGIISSACHLLSSNRVMSSIDSKEIFIYGITSVAINIERKKIPSICFFGDSLTNHGYLTDGVVQYLEKKNQVIIYNSGISGNRLLAPQKIEEVNNPAFGVSGIVRFDKDVIPYSPDVVIVLIGINDLMHPGVESEENTLPTLADFIEAYNIMINKSLQSNIIPIFLTITPFYDSLINGKLVWSKEKERLRQEINKWILTQTNSIDLATFVANKTNIMKLDDQFDLGDKIHFSSAGGKMIGKFIVNELVEYYTIGD